MAEVLSGARWPTPFVTVGINERAAHVPLGRLGPTLRSTRFGWCATRNRFGASVSMPPLLLSLSLLTARTRVQIR
jgi:hypothetical protein